MLKKIKELNISRESRVQIIASVFLILFLASFNIYAAWQGPTANPPGNNVYPPINVGDATQLKIGALGIMGVLRAYNYLIVQEAAGPQARLGIGTTAPVERLDVNGNANISGMTITNSLRIRQAAQINRFLRSQDNAGNTIWSDIDWVDVKNPPRITGSSGTENYIPRWITGGSELGDSIMSQNGNNITIAGSATMTNLTAGGRVTTNTLTVSNGSGNGRVLTDSGGGNAAWQVPSVDWSNILNKPVWLADNQISWTEIINKPAILADDQIAWAEVINKPAWLADNLVSWGEIQSIPAGFADGVDNVGGDIPCNWVGDEVASGNQGGYEDDLFLTCSGGFITRMGGFCNAFNGL